MSTTMPNPNQLLEPNGTPRFADIAACLDCGERLLGQDVCLKCERDYREHGGIVSAIGPLTGRNQINWAFYDGPGWARFRPWERLFLRVQGGKGRARRQILKHLEAPPFARGLEVGIGDGENLDLLPRDWTVFGIDLAWSPLEDCLDRHPEMTGRLARSEAEALPFEAGIFDATWSIGGFNYFRDHAATLREMRRVTRAGGTLVVADEIPNLHRFGIGHLLGLKSVDAFWLRALGLDRDFVAMVLDHKFDPNPVVEAHWPGAVRHSIWGGLGYCFVLSDATPFL